MASIGNLQPLGARPPATSASPVQQPQANVVSKEYYVKVPNRSKKRYHALKFHTSNVDMASWNKAEMARDMSQAQTQRPEWETLPKAGQGSEYGREAKEMARRRKYGAMGKKASVDDMPWILTNKGTDKAKERQYIGKKSVSENSSYFVFIKCADGGFEAHPLEDWYSFAPHKTYKTLNFEEAEEEFKRRHKILNKYMIMANKRKADVEGEDDEEEGGSSKAGSSGAKGTSLKSTKDSWVSDGEDDDKKGKAKGKGYKSSNLSDDDEEEGGGGSGDESEGPSTKKKPAGKKGKKKEQGSDDEEAKDKEDSDDGDHEGVEKDYSTSDSSDESEPETAKFEEKYQQKGIDEEEAIKALDKSEDSESEEDEGLTEEGKEYRKLMSKEDKDGDSDGFDDFFKPKNGKNDEDSKDSSSSFDDSDFESDLATASKQKKPKIQPAAISETTNKLKRKASEDFAQSKLKKQNKSHSSANLVSHDESSSSSSTSAANLATKSNKTAAIIAATAAANAANSGAKTSQAAQSAAKTSASDNSGLTEDEVRRYLSRKPMTIKELLHKFKSKTQKTMTNQQLVENLRAILDKLKAVMNEQNGVKYLSLP